MEWVSNSRYLGVTWIHSPHFSSCVDETLKKFYRASTTILRVDGRSDDMVMSWLLETHCVSVLAYAIEVVDIADRRQKSEMSFAYNSIFDKPFNYSWRESDTSSSMP